MTEQELRELKDALGPLQILDYSDRDMVAAHAELGSVVGPQVWSYLSLKLDDLSHDQIAAEVRAARESARALAERSRRSDLPAQIQAAMREYAACLNAWQSGARLSRFEHPALRNLTVDGTAVSGQDLAFLMQNEETGCQTGVWRDEDGSVIVWHTEEDVELPVRSRIDHVRLFTFLNRAGRQITSFIYPDLLPGPAFGWSGENYLQAVDTLNVKPFAGDLAVSANLVAWLCLYLGPGQSVDDMVRTIGPIRAGYAITTVRRQDHAVVAQTSEFAGDYYRTDTLPDTPGCARFQVNLLSQRTPDVIDRYEQVSDHTKAMLERRIRRTQRYVKSVNACERKVEAFRKLLASRVGADYSYSNRDVKGYLLARCSLREMTQWIGVGPAMKGDDVWRFVGSRFNVAR